MTRPVPQAMVQPSVPWPVASNRFCTGVGPTMGVPSGVMGRRPHQKVALLTSPPLGNRSVTTWLSVLRRGSRSLARGLAPNQVGAQVVAGLAIAATAFLVTWMVLQPGLPVWWPFGGAPSIFTSLTQAP